MITRYGRSSENVTTCGYSEIRLPPMFMGIVLLGFVVSGLGTVFVSGLL